MKKNSRVNHCQVCGARIKDNVKNCDAHSYVSERMALLAQEINKLESSVSPEIINKLAAKHGCHPMTVRNHMKRQGFNPKRTWENPNKKKEETDKKKRR